MSKKNDVYLIGPDPNYPGGIESVIRVKLEYAIPEFNFYNLVSWRPNSYFGFYNWIKILFKLIRLKASSSSVIIHCHLGNGGSWIREGSIALFGTILNLKTVVTLHGSSLENASGGFLRFISRILYFNKFSSIVTLTPSTFEKLSRYYSNVVLVPNPMPLNRELLDWKGEDSKNILFIGLIDTRKGADNLLAAWEEISTQYHDWSITLIGPMGDLTHRLKSAMNSNSVNWIGVCEPREVAEHLRNCAFIVLPSLREQSPMVIWEAIQTGTPVLASSLSGIKFQLGFDYPLLTPPGDTEILSQNLRAMMDQKSLRVSMSDETKRRRTLATPENVKDRYSDLYHSVLKVRN